MSHFGEALLVGALAGAFGFAISHLFTSTRRVVYAGLILFGAGLLAALIPGVPFVETGYGVAAAMVMLIVCSTLSERSLRNSVRMAPAVSAFALKNFDRLDKRGDKVISRDELEVALAYDSYTPAERVLLKRLAFDLCLAGHVIDTLVAVSPHSNGVSTLNLYGVNRSELESYPSRVRAEYERQYGTR